MIELLTDARPIASLAPAQPGRDVSLAEPIIDAGHLARMTLGDTILEREVLHLFDVQSAMLVDRMRQGPAAGIATSAHTLKGSARGIGAWRIARAAERVELTAAGWRPGLGSAIDELARSVDEAHQAIADLLQMN
jgi:HPt (histidine-containing phosphotransfer) domain-containing protein